jgi:hypothetical protein
VVRQISSDCLERELELWEKNKGRLPNAEEADLIIDMCVKRAYDTEKDKKDAQPR